MTKPLVGGKPDGQVLLEALLWIGLMVTLFGAFSSGLKNSGEDFIQAIRALEAPLPKSYDFS